MCSAVFLRKEVAPLGSSSTCSLRFSIRLTITLTVVVSVIFNVVASGIVSWVLLNVTLVLVCRLRLSEIDFCTSNNKSASWVEYEWSLEFLSSLKNQPSINTMMNVDGITMLFIVECTTPLSVSLCSSFLSSSTFLSLLLTSSTALLRLFYHLFSWNCVILLQSSYSLAFPGLIVQMTSIWFLELWFPHGHLRRK